jgi:carboxylate-amine ligase
MQRALTLGVEEEFLLVDPETWQVTARAGDVLAALPEELRSMVRHELLATQIEIATPICHDLDELRRWLVYLRRRVAEAAERAGCRLMAAGTGLLDFPGTPPVAPGGRYARMATEFRALIEIQGVCACHVHVGVDDRDLAAAVSNHLRPWLPVLHALSVNSPFADGRDTGYASWRSVLVSRWPSSGPPPWLESAEHHDRTVADLVSAGAMIDTRMVYWYARLSPRYPTIEMRTGDVCSTVDEAVLVAALTRALVADAITRVRAGRRATAADDVLLQAAHWRAARDGMEGMGVDVLGGELRPAWQLVDRLLTQVDPALDGDLDRVEELVQQVRASGSGAARQRAVFAERGDIAAVARFLVEQTAAAADAAS